MKVVVKESPQQRAISHIINGYSFHEMYIYRQIYRHGYDVAFLALTIGKLLIAFTTSTLHGSL